MTEGDVDSGDDYMTPGEAAEYLHVHPRTIARWAGGGRVPYVLTLGGQRRYRQKDIEDVARRMVARGARDPAPPVDESTGSKKIGAKREDPEPTA